MKRILFSSLLIVLFAACDEKPDRPDTGTMNGRTYTNEFFNFTIDVPEKWIIHNEREKNDLNESGREELQEIDSSFQEKLESAEQRVLPLLSVFKYKIGSTEQFNPSFIVMSEKLPQDLAGMNEPAYLQITKAELEQTGLYQTFEQINLAVKVGGEDFYVLRVSSKQQDVVSQEFYTRFVNGYALIMILSYVDAKQKEELKTILSNVSFD
jgi:hypothetical protein